MQKAQIGVIGGSGLYDVEGLEILEKAYPETPWGKPTDEITIGTLEGRTIAFLPRHGKGHFVNPSEVPSRANIAALKKIGVEEIIAFSAVGSLKEEIAPRDFVLPSQIIDRTKGVRPSTFFENGIVAHVTFGDPFTDYLAEIVKTHASVLSGVKFHSDKTLICMEGPAFSTRAESNMYRQLGGDIINMSVLPEAKLAREAEISYQMICMSTDYDSWKVEEEPVTVEMVIGNLNANAENAKRLLKAMLPDLGKTNNPWKGSVQNGIITAPEKRNPESLKKLDWLFAESP